MYCRRLGEAASLLLQLYTGVGLRLTQVSENNQGTRMSPVEELASPSLVGGIAGSAVHGNEAMRAGLRGRVDWRRRECDVESGA